MLTAAEWLSENSERQELALQNIPLAMELYAKYRETELSRPPKDVVEAIEKEFPDVGDRENYECQDDYTVNQIRFIQRTAALHGYSLASGEAVEFGKWLSTGKYRYALRNGNEWIDIHSTDGTISYTTAQLFELFKKERNG